MAENGAHGAEGEGATKIDTTEVSKAIEQTLWELHQLELTLESFKEENQLLLLERINNVVKELGRVYDLRGTCEGVQVPLDILKCVDEGKRPSEYTEQCLAKCVEDAEATNGKVHSLKMLLDELHKRAAEEYPAESAAFWGESAVAKEAEGGAEHMDTAPAEAASNDANAAGQV